MSEAFFDLWWRAFLSTLIVEVPIYALVLRSLDLPRALVLGIACQAVTHPCFWLSWNALGDGVYDHYVVAVIAFETVITLIEAMLCAVVLKRDGYASRGAIRLGLIASVVANASSVLVGYLK